MGGSDHTCPAVKNADQDTLVGVPIVGSVTFQNLIMYICAGCVGIAGLLCCFTIFTHLGHYSVPKQQRQIIRVLFTPVVFALFSVFTQFNYNDAIYMPPIRDLYEAFALASLFLLFVEYVAPDPSTRTTYFANLENREPRGGRFSKDKGYNVVPGGMLKWYKAKHIAVFLFVVVDLVITIAQEASQAAGTYCVTSLKPYFAHLWVLIIGHVAVVVGVVAILRYYGRMRSVPEFSVHRPLLKLVALKVIVFTDFVQTLIFSILQGQGVLTGNDKVTANDLQYGIPSLIVAIEQVIFAAFMLYAYRVGEYKGESKQMGFFAAALNALNPLDLIQGILTAFTYLSTIARPQPGASNGGWQANYSSGNDTNLQAHKYGSQDLSMRQQSPTGVVPNYGGEGNVPVGGASPGMVMEYGRHQGRHERRAEKKARKLGRRGY